MSRPFPWFRILAGILSAAAFAGGTYFLHGWWRLRSQLDREESVVHGALQDVFGNAGTRPLEVDPRVEFTCGGFLLVVEHNLPDRSPEGCGTVLVGLSAWLDAGEPDGTFRPLEPLNTEKAMPFESGGGCSPAIPLGSRLNRDPKPLRLRVLSPARALVGVPHRVTVRYSVCGLDHLAALASGATAAAGFLVSALFAGGIWIVTRRKRRQTPPA
jgi:hypothetical protein